MYKPLNFHNCDVVRSDCQQVSCGRVKWWAGIAYFFCFIYETPVHECFGYDQYCIRNSCPPSSWTFIGSRKLRGLMHLIKYDYLGYKYSGDSEGSDSGFENDWFDELSIGGSVITDTDMESSDDTSESESDSDTSIDYNFNWYNLPPLKPYIKESHDTDLLMVYSLQPNTNLAFRCKHMSRNNRWAKLKQGANYYCLCHGHSRNGFGANININADVTSRLMEVTTLNRWKKNFILYTKGKLPTLFQLAMANLWGNETHFSLYERYSVPDTIKKRIPQPRKMCLRLNCPAEKFSDCSISCRTRLQCRYAETRRM